MFATAGPRPGSFYYHDTELRSGPWKEHVIRLFRGHATPVTNSMAACHPSHGLWCSCAVQRPSATANRPLRKTCL